jgi:hypothetical protein
MSIQDDIEKLRSLASSERIPVELIALIQEGLLQMNSEVAAILGEGHGFYHGIGACAAQINEHLAAAQAACLEYETAIHDAADRLEQGGS